MMDRLFDQPIFVRQGSRLTREICSVRDAVDYLEEWPAEQQDLVYETVLGACYDALDGSRPVSAAQRAFERFARRAEILEESETAMPWIVRASHGSGQVSA